MIKLLLFLAFIWSAFPREKDPWGGSETNYPVAELFASETDPLDFFKFLNKRVKAIVEGPYVEIQSICTYENAMDHLVAAMFEFPQMENDISQKVEVRHQDTALIFFDEANSPNEEYAKVNPYTNERFSYKEIQTGCLGAHETVEVIFTVTRPLKISLNQFYELSIIPHHMPRFTAIYSPLFKANYNIQVELRSERPFATFANPQSHIQPKLSNHTNPLSEIITYKAFYNHTMYGVDMFTRDFKIYFATSDFNFFPWVNAPQTIMATAPFNSQYHAFMFSLIPDMNYFPDSGWDQNFRKVRPILRSLSDPINFFKLKKMTVQSDLYYFRNEYLFVIDQSDSMRGPLLENLKKTLTNFLGTLSTEASFYSILSFGNTSRLHWKRPGDDNPEKTPEDTKQIMRWVETLEADMGEKDLLSALKFAFEEYEWSSLPKNVIILTDNEISNADEIIQLVQTNSNSQKICALDVSGDGDIIRKIAEAGGCRTELIPSWLKDFDDRALNVLNATLTSPGFNLAYEITCVNDQNQVVHQEEGGSAGISKDKAFIKWVTLHSIPNLNSCKAKIFYYSQHRCSSYSHEIEIFRSQAAQLTGVWHKVANHAQLHDDLQIEESKRKLKVRNMQETPAVLNQIEYDVINSCQSQEITQEELIHNKRSLVAIYQEQFHNLWCYDQKRPLLSGTALSKSVFESFRDKDEEENPSLRNEEREKENFSSRHEEIEDESFFSFKTICIASVWTLLFVVALKIILK